MALHEVRRAGEVEVVGLLTTVNSAPDRVAMHAVRRSLLEAQADALGLPLHAVELPWPCSNKTYEELFGSYLKPGEYTGGNFLPALAVDRSTNIVYLAYPTYRPFENRFTVEVITSSDRGATWTDPVEISRAPHEGHLPAIHQQTALPGSSM